MAINCKHLHRDQSKHKLFFFCLELRKNFLLSKQTPSFIYGNEYLSPIRPNNFLFRKFVRCEISTRGFGHDESCFKVPLSLNKTSPLTSCRLGSCPEKKNCRHVNKKEQKIRDMKMYVHFYVAYILQITDTQ